jgi:hypothetical protein
LHCHLESPVFAGLYCFGSTFCWQSVTGLWLVRFSPSPVSGLVSTAKKLFAYTHSYCASVILSRRSLRGFLVSVRLFADSPRTRTVGMSVCKYIYAMLMAIGKMITGLWLVRFSPSPVSGLVSTAKNILVMGIANPMDACWC